jgi:hypothetical protein
MDGAEIDHRRHVTRVERQRTLIGGLRLRQTPLRTQGLAQRVVIARGRAGQRDRRLGGIRRGGEAALAQRRHGAQMMDVRRVRHGAHQGVENHHGAAELAGIEQALRLEQQAEGGVHLCGHEVG